MNYNFSQKYNSLIQFSEQIVECTLLNHFNINLHSMQIHFFVVEKKHFLPFLYLLPTKTFFQLYLAEFF